MKLSAVFLMAAFLAFWPFSSSSNNTYQMRSASIVPAATGTVTVQRGRNNGNVTVDVKVKNLALPSSLTPPEDEYVVWLEPTGSTTPVKLGTIGVGNNLQGELKGTTTSKSFNLIITAEEHADVTSPSKTVVLSTHVS